MTDNTEDNITGAVDNALSQLPDDCSVEREEVRQKIEEYVEMDVPADEASGSVAKTLAEKYGVSEEISSGGSEQGVSPLSELNPDEWATVEVTVSKLFDDTHDSISQSGYVTDGTDSVRFVSWEKSSVPHLHEGQSLRMENVKTDEYQDEVNIQLNSETEFSEAETEIEPATIEGPIVSVTNGSGLLWKDSETGQFVKDKSQAEGEPEDVLRAIVTVDDGYETTSLIFDNEQTEELTGVSKEEAIEIAHEAFDRSKVTAKFRELLIGRYIKAEGKYIGDIDVDEFEFTDEQSLDTDELGDLLVEVRSL